MKKILMNKESFVKNYVNRVHSILIKEGYEIEDDYDNDEYPNDYEEHTWKEAIEALYNIEDDANSENSLNRNAEIQFMVRYTDVDGNVKNMRIGKNVEGYDQLEKLGSKEPKYGEKYERLFDIVSNIANQRGSEVAEIQVITTQIKGHQTKYVTKKKDMQFGDIKIIKMDVVNFDKFYREFALRVQDNPGMQIVRGYEYEQPIKFISEIEDKYGEVVDLKEYNGTLVTNFRYSPLNRSITAQYEIKNLSIYGESLGNEVYRMGKQTYTFDRTREFYDDKIGLGTKEKTFGKYLKGNVQLWFSIYVRLNEGFRMDAEESAYGNFVRFESLDTTSREDMIAKILNASEE